MTSTHDRAARLIADPEWVGISAAQREKGVRKYGKGPEMNPGPAAYWRRHALEESIDGAVYALRVSDTGHPVRGRLAAFLFALAARVLLPVR